MGTYTNTDTSFTPPPNELYSPTQYLVHTHLNLTNTQVQEGLVITDIDTALRPHAAHAGTQAAVQLHHSKLGEEGADGIRIVHTRKGGVVLDLQCHGEKRCM